MNESEVRICQLPVIKKRGTGPYFLRNAVRDVEALSVIVSASEEGPIVVQEPRRPQPRIVPENGLCFCWLAWRPCRPKAPAPVYTSEVSYFSLSSSTPQC
jgi:hypothetical protein